MPPIMKPPPMRVGGLNGVIPVKANRRPRNKKAGGTANLPTCCENPDPHEEDGVKICRSCFTELSNVNITAEVTFEDQAGGRSTVQGGLVGENARFSKTLGAGAYRRIGGGERNSMVEIENAGRRALAGLAAPLKIPDNITQQAASVWSLAALNNFMAGRRTDEVAAACMWAACRRQKDNDVLLMDMAEILRINVFRLGEVYKDLCEKLYLEGKPVGYQHFVEMEPLIKKYCQKLQFGDKTNQVGYDALRIMKRMNRDWIVSGRHPAGLCGACIILAARMNNFQRSVRELVYVSKVADVTIAKRVEEFRRTKSAGLTVDEFRKFGNRMVFQHDPPSVYESAKKEQKLEKQRARRAAHMRESQERASVVSLDDASARSTATPGLATPPPTQDPLSAIPLYAPPVAPMTMTAVEAGRKRSADDGSASPNKRSRPSPPPTQPRVDADGFAIPALPIDPHLHPASSSSTPEPRKRGRPKKATSPPPVQITTEELADENYLEEQISQMLEDGQIEDAQNEVLQLKEQERVDAQAARARATAAEQTALDNARIAERRAAEGIVFGAAPAGETVSAEDLAAEFEGDVEVENCLLSPEEIRTKEMIWVHHNEDWLRKQAEKEMLLLVAKATGLAGTGVAGGRKGRKAKKKRSKMGDRTVLTEAETPIASPVDAAKAMLEKRAPQKSAHVDFSALQRIYGKTGAGEDDEASSVAPSREGSPYHEDDGLSKKLARREEGEEEQDGEEDRYDENENEHEEDMEEEEEDPEEADYRKALALGAGPEMDEFGIVADDGYDDEEGEEYE